VIWGSVTLFGATVVAADDVPASVAANAAPIKATIVAPPRMPR